MTKLSLFLPLRATGDYENGIMIKAEQSLSYMCRKLIWVQNSAFRRESLYTKIHLQIRVSQVQKHNKGGHCNFRFIGN